MDCCRASDFSFLSMVLWGYTLKLKTAIEKHLIACINMLNKLIHHAELVINDNNK